MLYLVRWLARAEFGFASAAYRRSVAYCRAEECRKGDLARFPKFLRKYRNSSEM